MTEPKTVPTLTAIQDAERDARPTLRDMAVERLREVLSGIRPAHEAVDALLSAANWQQTEVELDVSRRVRALEAWRDHQQDTQVHTTEDVVFWRSRALTVERQNTTLRQEASAREAEIRRITALSDELARRLAEFVDEVSAASDGTQAREAA